MAKKVKKAKRVRKVKPFVVEAWLAGPLTIGDPLIAGCGLTPKRRFEMSGAMPTSVLICYNTPANRKRLGVKRG